MRGGRHVRALGLEKAESELRIEDAGCGGAGQLPEYDLHDLPRDHTLAGTAGNSSAAPPTGEVDVRSGSRGGLIPEDGACPSNLVNASESVNLGNDRRLVVPLGTNHEPGAPVCTADDEQCSGTDRLRLTEALDFLMQDVAMFEP